MTDIAPFRALRYDGGRVELERVLAPVYDVVAPQDRSVYYDRDPHNALRLVLTRSVEEEATTDYADVARNLAQWRAEGVLALDSEPALYVLRQRFTAPGGDELERVGFFGALRLEGYEKRMVRPHEDTLAGPKADRLKILRASQANLSSVFLLYEDREMRLAEILGEALRSSVAFSVRNDEEIQHTLAPIRDPGAIARVRAFLAERPVVIADGHHRYETALTYRDERRAASASSDPEAPHERLLAYFANAFAPGSLLLPIHRVILKLPPATGAGWRSRLREWEQRTVQVSGIEAIPAALEEHLAPLRGSYAFAADDGSGTLRIFSRAAGEELSVRVIHREVLGDVFDLDEDAVRDGAVAFPKSTLQAAREVREGGGAVALYLNPVGPDDVFRVTGAGETLPQKSTFFFPKLPTGLLFRVLEAGT
jgi:uncharacterized protein (DUF1015 family)